MKKLNIKKLSLLVAVAIGAAYLVTAGIRAYTLRRPAKIAEPDEKQLALLETLLNEKYERRGKILLPLPYRTIPAELDVGAEAAIAIDASNGNILYEKDADRQIPPASMTKLFVLYVVFQEIATGRINLDDVVPLPPETWACNMPPHSSLMFLGKNHIVTLEELMLGSAICSGNDAACAIANYVCGGMDSFINRMNQEVQALGLTQTHFVEASGYSEKNMTTPREMAAFAKVYLERYPESLYKFHSKLSFTYPQEHNLSWEDKSLPKHQDFSQGIPEHITMPVYQKNTNPLLGLYEGCDGLKTGYIDESGYNLALTVKRNGMRIISITMGGKGSCTAEGQAGRIHDGSAIMDWAFNTFRDYENPLLLREYSIPLIFAKEQRAILVPAYKPKALTVPVTAAQNRENPLEEVQINLVLPDKIKGAVNPAQEFGYIEYTLNGHILESIPLVSEKEIKKACLWVRAADLVSQFVLKF